MATKATFPRITPDLAAVPTPTREVSPAPSPAKPLAFLQLQINGGRILVSSSIVAITGVSSDVRLYLDSGETLQVRQHSPATIAEIVDAHSSTPLLALLPKRTGFGAPTTYLRVEAIRSFALVDQDTIAVWFGTPAPAQFSYRIEDFKQALEAHSGLIISSPRRVAEEQPQALGDLVDPHDPFRHMHPSLVRYTR